jgi:DNA-binding NarL/FixJ family response regulator
MTNICIADDQLLFRKGMTALVNGFNHMRVILEAENGKDLLEKIQSIEEPVHVVLLDLSMPKMNGLETMQQLHHIFPAIKVIVLSVHADDKFITRMLELGANGYLVKNAQPAEVEQAINTVVANDFYLNDQTLAAMRKGIQSGKQKVSLDVADTLTNREKEILKLICKEYTTSEIAAQLFISERTVEGHRNNLLLKTGTRNTAGLVVFAIKNNVVEVKP